MPAWLAVCILGIIEGVTEFLPISSTGHLLLAENSHWLPHQSDLFNITIQSGAALAVLFAFSARVRQLLSGLGEPATRSYVAKLVLIALARGVARPAATEFSCLVGVPTLLAAGLYETQHALRHPGPMATDWGLLAFGTVVSAVTAFLVVRWLIRWIQTHNFSPFGWYRIALGLAMLTRVI